MFVWLHFGGKWCFPHFCQWVSTHFLRSLWLPAHPKFISIGWSKECRTWSWGNPISYLKLLARGSHLCSSEPTFHFYDITFVSWRYYGTKSPIGIKTWGTLWRLQQSMWACLASCELLYKENVVSAHFLLFKGLPFLSGIRMCPRGQRKERHRKNNNPVTNQRHLKTSARILFKFVVQFQGLLSSDRHKGWPGSWNAWLGRIPECVCTQ